MAVPTWPFLNNSKTKERAQKGQGEPWVGEHIALCIDEQPWGSKQGRPALQDGN